MGDLKKLSFSALMLAATAVWASPQPKVGNVIRGKVTGYEVKNNDDRVDGGFVFAPLDAQALLSFQLDKILGPSETLKAGPVETKVPGNLHFPKQREWYGVFPVNIDKSTFGVPFEAGQQDELFALWFSAPFDEMVDKARAKAPYGELLKLVSFRGFGLLERRDWTTEPRLELKVDKRHEAGFAYAWNRAAPGAHEWDGLVSFQKTWASKWVISDFVNAPAASGTANRIGGVTPDQRALFFRVKNTDDDKKPQALVAHFATSSGEAVALDGVPAFLSGVTLDGATVKWDAIAETGWIAILRGEENDLMTNKSIEPLAVIGDMGFASLFAFSKPFVAWVAPEAGQFDLGSALGEKENLTLVFVKTDVAVPAPEANDPQEPLMFQHAQQIRMQIVK